MQRTHRAPLTKRSASRSGGAGLAHRVVALALHDLLLEGAAVLCHEGRHRINDVHHARICGRLHLRAACVLHISRSPLQRSSHGAASGWRTRRCGGIVGILSGSEARRSGRGNVRWPVAAPRCQEAAAQCRQHAHRAAAGGPAARWAAAALPAAAAYRRAWRSCHQPWRDQAGARPHRAAAPCYQSRGHPVHGVAPHRSVLAAALQNGWQQDGRKSKVGERACLGGG